MGRQTEKCYYSVPVVPSDREHDHCLCTAHYIPSSYISFPLPTKSGLGVLSVGVSFQQM